MQVKRDPERWAVFPRRNPSAELRLFCFPYAGGSAAAYRLWPNHFGPRVEVCAVQLPGREARFGERPYDRVMPLAADLAEILRPYFDRPFAFFGHSMGSLIAFELIRELRRAGRPLPATLVASGRNAPHLPPREPLNYNLPEPELLEKLRRFEGTPEEVLANQELMRLLLPLLRADFAVNEAYTPYDEPPFDLPILALGGTGDEEVTREGLDAWSQYTASRFAVRIFPGGHFFLNSSPAEVTAAVREEIRAATGIAA
ncbi:MAG TPA: alpha/beta fold hydrolase [Longimicrobiaceae bacterium]|nr:alpha/beta fold hydrolase [Longimicrobiaceae bacterium]